MTVRRNLDHPAETGSSTGLFALTPKNAGNSSKGRRDPPAPMAIVNLITIYLSIYCKS
ncbi:hypothetical protein PSEUDO9AG_40843 [Pseudomonas sp. 9Ag]|nr:hypothetical protein PSEUDO9AG_40843 [Pseudomonas sp. 9Ag]